MGTNGMIRGRRRVSEKIMEEASKSPGWKRKEESPNYEKDLFIDKFTLDSECIDQPRRFFKYSEQWAEAVRERDKAKQDLKVIKAQVIAKAKEDASVIGLDKWTDVAGAVALEGHPKIVEAVNNLIEAEHRENILFSAVEAFRDRRGQLSSMVQLYLSGYWSEVKIPKGSSDRMGEKEGEAQREHLNRKLR